MKGGSFSARKYITDNCEPTNQMRPPIEFSCQRTMDRTTGLLSTHISWSYEYNPLIEEAISEKKVFLSRQNGAMLLVGATIALDPEVYCRVVC